MPRKVFVAGEILTASDVNTNLMDQSVMVFDDATARTTAIPTPVEGMVTYLKDTNLVQAFDGSAFTAVGGILQVVQTAKTDVFSASVLTGAFTAVTGYTASITPTSALSKILVFFSVSVGNTDGSTHRAATRVLRDSTVLTVGDAGGASQPRSLSTSIVSSSTSVVQVSINGCVLDTPNTSAEIIYSVEVGNPDTSTRTVFVNRDSNNSNIVASVRSASTITLMEVAG